MSVSGFFALARRRTASVVPLALLASSLSALAPAVTQSASAADSPPAPRVASRPDPVSAQLAAKVQGSRVEVSAAETATATTYANPDGTFTVEHASGPVRVAQPDGSWRPLDLALKADVAGRLAPAAAPQAVTFSAGGSSDAVTLADDGGKSLGLGWPSRLPDPSVVGGVASYQLSKTMTLQLATTGAGFNAHVILTAPPTRPLTFRLPLSTHGLSVSQRPDGGFTFSGSDGRPFAAMAPLRMWDSSAPGFDEPLPSEQRPVDATLVRGSAGAELVLTPSMSYLTDPSTVYPVTIDPDVASVQRNGDTYWYTNNTTPQISDYRLMTGTWDSGATKYRAFADFDTSAYSGTHVTKATLKMFQYAAGACTAKTMNIYQSAARSDSGTIWSNAPGIDTTMMDSPSFNTGGVGCNQTNQYMFMDVTNIVNAWTLGTKARNGMQFRAGSETDNTYSKRFCSFNPDASSTVCMDGSRYPTLSITYNTYPNTPTSPTTSPSGSCVTGASRPYVNTSMPTLKATVTDADAGSLYGAFSLYRVGGSQIGTESVGTGVSTGSASAFTVPSSWGLTNGSAYSWHARAYDGTDYSKAYSASCEFTVDTAAPSVSALSSSAFASGDWTSATSGTINWSGYDNLALSGYWTQLDNNAWSFSGGTSRALSGLASGWHTFNVQAQDQAGNYSPVATFSFGVGAGYALTSPADQDRTQARVTLTGTELAGRNYVWYRYRIGTSGAFTNIPTSNVTMQGTSTHPASPIAGGEDGTFPPLTWTVTDNVSSDGLVQVEACYYSSPTDSSPICSPPNRLQVDAHAFGQSYAVTDVGPGLLSLVTGDYQVSTRDAAVDTPSGELSIGRTSTTLAPPAASSTAEGVFGPGWTADLPGPDTGLGDVTLTDRTTSGYVTLNYPDGGQDVYAVGATTNNTTNFTPIGDAAGDAVTLTKDLNANQYRLLDSDGTTTVWSAPASGTVWRVAQVIESGGNDTTSYIRDAQGRVNQIVAPAPAGINCTSTPLTTTGCRTLTLTYAVANSTGLGNTAGSWGDFAGRLTSVQYVAADPTNNDTMAPVEIAHYAYDATGRLRAAWDPRLATAGAPLLKTVYGYDTNGRLASVIPPSDPAHPAPDYTFAYDGSGRLTAVSQQDPANGPATVTVAYNIPVDGTGAPVDMSSTRVQAWDQHDLPTVATAVFPPDHVPAATPTAGDWQYATLHYVDVNGRETNTASFGAGDWQIDTVEYDAAGNVTRSLAAAARAEALDLATPQNADYAGTIAALVPANGACADAGATKPLCTVQRALLLDTENTYSSDGSTLLETRAPLTPVRLDDGSDVDARQRTVNTYDTGAPTTGGPYRLVTKRVVSAQTTDGVDHDPKTTTFGYEPINAGDTSGWALRQATIVTTDMGSGNTALTSTTRYDSHGNPIESRMPSEPNGGGPGTTLTTYYTDTGTGSCADPATAGYVCSTAPAAQPATGAPLPTTTVSYDRYGNITKTVESYGTSGVTRTTSTTYDAAERPSKTSVAVTPTSAGGTAVPDVTTSYDPTTGLIASVNDGSSSVQHHYDALGRETSYTDADGNSSTTSYDIDGRVVAVDDGKGVTRYTYDGGSGEHRGLITSIDAGIGTDPSTFSGSYDDAGRLTRETYPNGLQASWHYDESNQARSLTYTKDGTTWLTFTIGAYSNGGQIRSQSSPMSSQDFGYDNAGRLTRTTDKVAADVGTVCTTRAYTYNANTDRTRMDVYPDDGSSPQGGCSTITTPVTTSYTVNAADQLTATTAADGSTGTYSYDSLGRILSVPSTDAAGHGALTIGYYANDLVASQEQTYTDPDGPSAGLTLNHRRTWALDPTGRLHSQEEQRLDDAGAPVAFTDPVDPANNGGTTGVSTVNHYSSDSDSPSWIKTNDSQGATSWSRNIAGLDGSLAAIQPSTGTPQLQLVNPHGDIVATVDDATSATGTNNYVESTEFGTPRDTSRNAPRYGWLGGSQRSSDDLANLVLMGARLYNPATGRFLSVDPVAGGSANDYDYCNQDPVNGRDLGGTQNIAPPGGGTTAKQAKRLTKVIVHYQQTHKPAPPPAPQKTQNKHWYDKALDSVKSAAHKTASAATSTFKAAQIHIGRPLRHGIEVTWHYTHGCLTDAAGGAVSGFVLGGGPQGAVGGAAIGCGFGIAKQVTSGRTKQTFGWAQTMWDVFDTFAKRG